MISAKMRQACATIGFSYYDQTTFYYRRHVSSLKPRSAKETLSSAQIATIREQPIAEISDSECRG
jgi:hypothetical protein